MFTPVTETGNYGRKKLKTLAAELAKGLKTEAVLNAELTDHLGHEKNALKTGSNTRNGYSSKTVLCGDGEIELNTPNTFEPHPIGYELAHYKHQHRLDDKGRKNKEGASNKGCFLKTGKNR
jgi:transposase-like protein